MATKITPQHDPVGRCATPIALYMQRQVTTSMCNKKSSMKAFLSITYKHVCWKTFVRFKVFHGWCLCILYKINIAPKLCKMKKGSCILTDDEESMTRVES